MKALPALGFLLALVISTAAMAEGPIAVPLHETPQPLPKISFSDESGNPLTLDRWNGKVVLLNVWATWCGPCRQEMPTLDRLQETLGSDRFVVSGTSGPPIFLLRFQAAIMFRCRAYGFR